MCSMSVYVYRFLLTVNLNRNSHDPRNPPRIVFSGVATNHGLLNCRSDNTIRARTDDRTADTGVDTARTVERGRERERKTH